MVLTSTKIKRVFRYNHQGTVITLDDIPSLSAEEVVKFYASQYPEITNARTSGPKSQGDELIYTIDTKVGKLG